MQLHQSSWQQVEAYLARSTGIVIPIGSTEQHGPNGLLGTDAICPEVIAARGAALGNFLVAPTFNVGCAQHHLGFPGTITLRPSTMIAAMLDWTTSLRRHGFTHFYWLNGHGGNIATINAAFAEIYAEGSLRPDTRGQTNIVCTLKNWWELPGIAELCKEMYPTGHGSHATPSEISVTWFAYPQAAEVLSTVSMSPRIAPVGPIRDAEDYRRRFPDGRIGSDPTQASIEDGRRIVEAAAGALAQDFARFCTPSE
ncbi:MAG: amidase [Proteobacteria bacterium]|nr:MAG: amidase [Pseudomonadota bacterium]